MSFVSLGCPKNLVDSEKMLGLLAEDGLAPLSYDPGEPGGAFRGADAVVVNTCGFLEASKEESLQVIHEALREKEKGNVKRVVVAGCLVQRHRARILEWAPGVDAMIGVFDRDHIVEAVRGAAPGRATLGESSDAPPYWVAANALQAARARGRQTVGLTVHGKDGKGIGYFEDDSARLRLTPRHYAYLRVSEGCNQNCAFCTIPSIRGKMRSKPLERIVAEARELVRDGAFELNLIGQDTTSYGDDLGRGVAAGEGLPGLLRAVSDAVREEGGAGWVRLMYAYPSNFTDEMIEAISALSLLGGKGCVAPYIDIPLQHASDRILEAMRRRVTADHQRALLGKLRDRVPGMAIRTTFITGFPGETEDDHRRLMEFVEEQAFEAMGVFEYSQEAGTPAGTMEQDPALAVPAEIKTRRREELMALQQRLAFEQAAYLGEQFDPADPAGSGVRLDVLIDGPADSPVPLDGRLEEHGEPATRSIPEARSGESLWKGRTYFQAPQIDAVTYVRSGQRLSPGELIRCAIVGSEGYDLVARPAADLERRVGLRVVR